MNKKIKYKDTLVYIDKPVLFTGISEEINLIYLFLLIDDDNYFVCPVEKIQYRMFLRQEIDLKTLLKTAEINYIYKDTDAMSFVKGLIVNEIEDVSEEWYPDDDFYVDIED
jgi:hypothetical protein